MVKRTVRLSSRRPNLLTHLLRSDSESCGAAQCGRWGSLQPTNVQCADNTPFLLNGIIEQHQSWEIHVSAFKIRCELRQDTLKSEATGTYAGTRNSLHGFQHTFFHSDRTRQSGPTFTIPTTS
ncbi:hypothetical protein CDAR_295881 [Caerostris darwini]|uniref:Uncharacterized protein n=1 Tax=Caerostris darwini TaxID=1538125 RepID=A0AAV4UTP4_9ARAC|nr:hypothetical protein CDAR_295881 [Caerostris darwini]